ncbi:CRISPR-associated DxTHG motif protein [Bremerella cremea]|nr:CRISPR-associated DxTHG motif protein [Bremerella cremea]
MFFFPKWQDLFHSFNHTPLIAVPAFDA